MPLLLAYSSISFSWSEVKQTGIVLFSSIAKIRLCKIITLSQKKGDKFFLYYKNYGVYYQSKAKLPGEWETAMKRSGFVFLCSFSAAKKCSLLIEANMKKI